MISLIIIFSIVLLVCIFLFISNFISIFSGAPFLKSDKLIIEKALNKVKLKPGEILYDLGSGNGEVLLVAEKFGARAVGFEISPFYYLWAKLRATIWRRRRRKYHIFRWSAKSGMGGLSFGIIVHFKNIFNVNLSKADVVYCYLLPKMLEKLTPKFQKELKKTARLISIDFQIKNMHLTDKLRYRKHTIYIYDF